MESDDPRELDDRGLGRRVRDVGNPKPTDARDGSNVNDRALPLSGHVRKHLLAGQKHALHVYVVDPVPTLLAGLDRAADLDDADIVVKHVDPAECQYASIDHRRNVIRTRRPKFLLRRRVGDLLGDAKTYRGEREIIARN